MDATNTYLCVLIYALCLTFLFLEHGIEDMFSSSSSVYTRIVFSWLISETLFFMATMRDGSSCEQESSASINYKEEAKEEEEEEEEGKRRARKMMKEP